MKCTSSSAAYGRLLAPAKLDAPSSSYGSINLDNTSHSQSSSNSSDYFQGTTLSTIPYQNFCSKITPHNSFIEIPTDVLNHIAGFLGYKETLQSLMPASSQLFLKIINDNFIIKMDMPMPNGSILSCESNYLDLKAKQLEEFEKQIIERFGDINRIPKASSAWISNLYSNDRTLMMHCFMSIASIAAFTYGSYQFSLDIKNHSTKCRLAIDLSIFFSSILFCCCYPIFRSKGKFDDQKFTAYLSRLKKSDFFRLDEKNESLGFISSARLQKERNDHKGFLDLRNRFI